MFLNVRHPHRVLLVLLALLALLAVASPVRAQRLSVPDPAPSSRFQQLRQDREDALQLKIDGKVRKDQKVVRLGAGRYVETALERTEKVFVVLVEFPDRRHNQLPPPDRSTDLFTPWEPDYSREYYERLIFGDMRRYFEAQSDGRYSISGHVTDWVTIPSGSYYAPDLAVMGIAAWLAGQPDAQAARDFLATFDRLDLFDQDQDGNFDEPDGVLDKVIVVEAGVHYSLNIAYARAGDEDRRMATSPLAIGATGLSLEILDGMSEAAPLGVFVHEYAHLLGLPDEYAYPLPAELYRRNSQVAHWSLMSAHWIFGERPGLTGMPSMGAWDRLQLGWLNYEVTTPGQRGNFMLGAAASGPAKTQAVLVNLPPCANPITVSVLPIDPIRGCAYWWSGQPVGETATMTRTISVPRQNPTLTMSLWFDAMGPGLDYTYVSVSTDEGLSWTNLASPGVTTTASPYGFNEGNGISGTSGVDPAVWGALATPVSASFNLAPYAGKNVLLRIRHRKNLPSPTFLADYLTNTCNGCSLAELLGDWGFGSFDELLDAYAPYIGVVVDDIRLGSWSDGAESADTTWMLDDFVVKRTRAPHYYLAEYRDRSGADSVLIDDLPLNDGGRLGYDPGLLVWYRNRQYHVQHTGRGLMVIDAHPAADLYANGLPLPNTQQLRDAAFSRMPTTAVTVPDAFSGNAPLGLPSLPAEPLFDDSQTYSTTLPWIGVVVPRTGTRIEVVNTNMNDALMHIRTGPR